MTIGVIAACMPSLARFVQHVSPNFSIIDATRSLRNRLLRRESIGSDTAQSSRPLRRQDPRSREACDSKRSLKQAITFNNSQGIELGCAESTKIDIRSDGVFNYGHPDGIYMQRSWEQSFA